MEVTNIHSKHKLLQRNNASPNSVLHTTDKPFAHVALIARCIRKIVSSASIRSCMHLVCLPSYILFAFFPSLLFFFILYTLILPLSRYAPIARSNGHKHSAHLYSPSARQCQNSTASKSSKIIHDRQNNTREPPHTPNQS